LAQCDLWEPREPVAVGHGQTRRGWVVTVELCWSRMVAGALVFSKETPDILWGLARNLWRLGALPEKLVWDREGAIAPVGRPTDAFAAFCGQLGVGWVASMLVTRRQRAFSSARTGSCSRTSCPGGSSRTNATSSCSSTVGETASTGGCTGRPAVPADRLMQELESMPPLPRGLPDLDRRLVMRVPAQPYLRLDRNDYSIDPRFAGRPVEVRVSQEMVSAVVLDSGELACRHRRVFAGGLTFTDPAHQTELDQARARRRQRHEVEVEIRPLARYDALIPA
jgi:hypothetical protein